MMSCYECKYNQNNKVCDLFDDILPFEYTCFMEVSKYEENNES